MKNPDSFITPTPRNEEEFATIIQELKTKIIAEKDKIDSKKTDDYIVKGMNTDLLFEHLPDIFLAHQIYARLGKKHIRSCIITDIEVASIAAEIYKLWFQQFSDQEIERLDLKAIFSELTEEQQTYFIDWVYHIPPAFKNAGYELYRPEEDKFITVGLAENLARAIHAKFRKHILEQKATDTYSGMYLDHGNADTFAQEYENLSDEMKAANIDNAFHIPTKLLAIGYKIEEVEAGTIPQLLKLSDNEIEAMAVIEHDRWSWERRLNGWIYAPERNNELKHHHCLVPYEKLPPHEQEKDRIMVRFIPALLMDIGYRAVKVSPELAEKISYINQRSGFVFEVETQIRNLQSLITTQNDEIQGRFDDSFRNIDSIDELKSEINSFHKYLSKQYLKSSLQRLETTQKLLGNIKGCYTSGSQIQRAFMPQSFELKEHFPESFILLRPKDVVSGDFYFVSKVGDKVLFAAADCTGHGVSGSILSGICYNYLHEATNIKGISNPLDVLSTVMPQIRELMKHNNSLTLGSGEMELGLCAIDTKTNKLQVAAYGSPVYAFLNGTLVRLGKGADEVENTVKDEIHFQEVQLNKGDSVYSLSDGYVDQFGGPKGKKFMSKRLKELLSDIQDKSMAEQCEHLNNELERWIHCEEYQPADDEGFFREQSDDISIVAVKV